ncbi:MAG: MBL fold metallo-hydrolase [Clostridia bacterium]|nr:MBL fold metallo-hydrolase [Clostridia bacterium]
MKIQYFGHSCFKITTKSGTTILTDPYKGVGYELPKTLTADVLSVSHGHFDHCNIAAVSAPIHFLFAGNYEVNDLSVTGVECYHDPRQGAIRGKNIVFTFEADGMRICHMGDVGEPCSDELAAKIGKVDVLLIPVGGTYTIDALGAKAYVEKLSPKFVIPMHYKPLDGTLDINTAQLFLSLFEKEEILKIRGGVFEFTKEDFSTSPKIIYMERINKR